MKAYKYIIAAAGLLLTFSCSDFLEYRDKDKVIPQTLDHYSELVYGELIWKSLGNTLNTLEFMTDDIGSAVKMSSSPTRRDERLRFLNYFTWAKESQIDGETQDEMIDRIWEVMYHKVLMCNIIEHDVELIATKSPEEVARQRRIIAEVQLIRALSYYYLVNTYGDVYKDAAQAAGALGVPINNETTLKVIMHERASLPAVYQKIEDDLDAAEDNFKLAEHKNTIFRPNMDILLLLRSRIYLLMHRYDEVIPVCNKLIESSLRTIAPAAMVKPGSSSVAFICKDNPGLLFSWMSREGLYTSFSDGRYVTSRELVDSYDAKDLRSDAYFGPGNWETFKKQENRYKISTYSGTLWMNYRIEEAYFNKAEAMLKTTPANYADALDEVNKVRKERLAKGGQLLEATSVEQAWTLFKAEKRREFCLEDIRWFDIRRWGERIIHKLQDFNNPNEYITYVLESNSPNYVMALPIDVMRINDKIERAIRIDSKTIPNE